MEESAGLYQNKTILFCKMIFSLFENFESVLLLNIFIYIYVVQKRL